MPETVTNVKRIQSRVRSFASDPLHSAAYLNNLVSYLTGKSGRPNRSAKYSVPDSPQPENNFLFAYKVDGITRPEPSAYANAAACTSAGSIPDCSEIFFAVGYPSREWLNILVDRIGVDHRFLHSHLDFLPSCQRDWYTDSSPPSRRQHSLRLLVPSIVFIGAEGRRLSVEELHQTRNDCGAHLRSKAKNFLAGTSVQPGQSIVRQFNIHSGDAIVLEQVLSVTFIKRENGVKGNMSTYSTLLDTQLIRSVFIWSDAGERQDSIPELKGSRFQSDSDNIEFCPVFFEQDLQAGALDESANAHINITPRTRQPLSVLPARYGETIDWNTVSDDPVLMLQELFHFQSSATAQYLDMLRKLTMDTIARTPPTGNTLPSMDDILHFEYTKNVLTRWSVHFATLIDNLDKIPLNLATGRPDATGLREATLQTLKQDLRFLKTEAEILIGLCDSGKSTIMSSFAVFESKQAAAESKLVTQLTKATNRITFVFLPISFVTSVFGMNFRQFGQGELSITMWLAVTLPLLVVCILLNERGSLFTRCFRPRPSG